jgi:uncharacterized protein (TIGR03067 family)
VKRVLSLILPAALLLAAEPADDAKKELEKLQGEWVMAALEVDGKAVPEEKLRDTTLTIKDDKYIVTVKETKHEVTFKLDPSQKPKAIDMSFPDGANLAKVGKGIYKIDGDTFVMCRAQMPDQARPTEFGTWPNTGYFLVTWKRKSP